MTQRKKYTIAIVMITSLFFFWGFIHNLDPILIPHLRNAFSLSHFQASLVDSAVFIAYFVLAIPAGLIMQKFGYKVCIVVGLVVFALGCFLFVPAANTINYYYFLVALFVVACGLTIIETAANPYMTALGDPAKAAQRLNFAQSFNGLSALIAPLVGGRFILAEEPKSAEEIAALSEQAKLAYIQAETASVKGPYVVLGIVVLVFTALFILTKLPKINEEAHADGAPRSIISAFRHSRVSLAVIAQFFYVGAQVCVLSFLVMFATDVAGVAPTDASMYAGVAGLAFMSGRFIGTFFMRYIAPVKLLLIYALIASVLTLVVIYGAGVYTLYALAGIPFFMSIMFPTIFAVGVEGIGADTKSASSLIVMSIVGGALLPPLLGRLSDSIGSFQLAYYVVLLCFIVVALFAWYNRKSHVAEAAGGH